MGRDRRSVRPGRAQPKRFEVVPTEGFADDVAAKIAWLNAHRSADTVRRFREDLQDARQLLSVTPLLGPRVAETPFLRLVLRRTPFVLWYAVERKRVLLLRLFHVRQQQRT